MLESIQNFVDHRSLLLLSVVFPAWSIIFLHRSFVSWDDNENFLKNPHLEGGLTNMDNLKNIATPLLGVVEPVATCLKLLVITISGWSPTGDGVSGARPFIICNLILHAFNTALSAKLAVLRHGGSDNFQWPRVIMIIAGIFAVHPLRVETVAWSSCLPYQAATFFCLCGCLLHENDRHRWKAVAFFLAVLSKASSVTVPLSLFAWDMWGDVTCYTFEHIYRAVRRNLTSMMMTMCGIVVAMWANQESPPVPTFSFDKKILRACYALWFYPLQTMFPSKLNIIYPLPNGGNIEGLIITSFLWVPLVGTILVLTWCFYVLFISKKENGNVQLKRFETTDCDVRSLSRRWSMFVVMYILTLLPTLGFIQHGYLTMAADRYSYLVSAVVFVPFLTVELEYLMQYYSMSLLFRKKIKTLGKSHKWHSSMLMMVRAQFVFYYFLYNFLFIFFLPISLLFLFRSLAGTRVFFLCSFFFLFSSSFCCFLLLSSASFFFFLLSSTGWLRVNRCICESHEIAVNNVEILNILVGACFYFGTAIV